MAGNFLTDSSVIFEDDAIVVIHKSSGIPFHTENKAFPVSDCSESAPQKISAPIKGITQLVKEYFGNEALYPVHRLDKVTSGLMVFAKSQEVNALLSQKFRSREIEKYYLALSSSKPSKKQGSVIGDMEKARNGSYKLLRATNNPAITRFKSVYLPNLMREPSHELARWLHLVKIESGKTHQIRVALKSISSPILGDLRYKGEGADRTYLHAFIIKFELNGKLYRLCDNNFTGDAFNLADVDIKHFNEPESLDWPSSRR